MRWPHLSPQAGRGSPPSLWPPSASAHPFRHRDRRLRRERVEQGGGVGADRDARAVGGGQEAALYHLVDETKERLIEAVDVEQPDRLVDVAELVEGPRLHHFL